ncbi:uncharacterized protein MYCFIDRAFT_75291 [Pseudocercospora fijiensis CIRAD86]|uniref:Uncharacterized protein n=1 Tax=Pseudocercospora fijiensis (strain CIRAD86) TaxID=383855 RepID=N1Q5W8_PSEFD|nr:uncharacterized protein MYCFIDRAFT_75291 [Pseudocercospora fijiensis CIRAD86]EME87434.1 hypothetical protein MYCFIDRAFT_75291 [Pseudocercospora fijiensis CIRAD86]
MGAPDDFPGTVNVKRTLWRLEDEHSPQYCLNFRGEMFRPSQNNFAQMPLTVVCEQKVKCIDWIKPEPGELRVLGNVRTEEAKEAYTERVIEHFKDNYESRADELGKFQDLCQHVGARQGQTVEECKALRPKCTVSQPSNHFGTTPSSRTGSTKTWISRLGSRGIRRHLAARGKPREIPDSLTFMLVNLCKARAGIMYDKELESVQVRAKNLMNSWSDLGGKTPEPTIEVREETVFRLPPCDEDTMGLVADLMKTLDIPDGV